MKGLFLVIATLSISCITANTSYAQYWAKTYGGDDDLIASSQQTVDGGYILAGTQSFGSGAGDFWVLKLDSNGNITWQKIYGGSNSEHAQFIEQTSDGGYIVGGVNSPFDPDAWILKLDNNGNITWQKTYGGSDDDYVRSIKQTSDGGYIVVGDTFSFGVGNNDCWVLKLDSDGNITWQKTYGGGGMDFTLSIEQTSDDGYIVGGFTYSFGAGGSDVWVLKLDSNGNITWQKTYGESNSDRAYSIEQTSDGGYIVAGHIGGLFSDAWVLKLDSSGNITWQKAYSGNNRDRVYRIQQTSDGGYIVAGDTSSFKECFYHSDCLDSWVLKLDGSGNIEWENTYYGTLLNDYTNSIGQTTDGGYLLLTGTFTDGPNTSGVLKLTNNGLIPNCDIAKPTAATITDTSMVAQDSTATIQTSSATVTVTDVIPQDAITEVLDCPSFDFDNDGIIDGEDNCPKTYDLDQEDTYPPQGNNIGDACDCEGDFDCDGDCDGTDASTFKVDFGRSTFNNPCNGESQCNGDFDCDNDCDGSDAALFKEDFGRSDFDDSCPVCVVGDWCNYQ